jgi:hypothetical protein
MHQSTVYCAKVKEQMVEKGFQALKHLPYSPDLALYNFFLFNE